MSEEAEGGMGGLRGMRRKAVEATELVTTSFLPGREGKYPIVLSPAAGGLSIWPRGARATTTSSSPTTTSMGRFSSESFDISNPEDFEKVASTITPDLSLADYGDLPPESASQRIYGVTPYPPDKTILFHNESSHLPTWPMRQFFFCIVPSAEGGKTPLLDCREVLEALDSDIVEQFEEKGLMYVRNFSEGIDVPWQDFFHTEDRAEVERQVTEAGMTLQREVDGLRAPRQPALGGRAAPPAHR